jgi:cation/acetate symporter
VNYSFSWMPFGVFLLFVGSVLGLSFYLGRKARSAKGYYAAHGQVGWFVNGVAFAGDYLSAASFLGICGMIAFFGYDGFLYSIGYLAGWVVALFVIAEPLKRLGKYTFADALDKKFNSRGIKLAAAISTLLVSLFYLIPQMVGAGALIQPLLGLPFWSGVVIVGIVVVFIVVTAGMVSTTWVQFIKGSLLVVFCLVLTIMILRRGLSVGNEQLKVPAEKALDGAETIVDATGGWKGKPYLRAKYADGTTRTWRVLPPPGVTTYGDVSFSNVEALVASSVEVSEAQTLTATPAGARLVNGLPQGDAPGQADLRPVGSVARLPSGQSATGPLGPVEYVATLQKSDVVTWTSEAIKEVDGSITTVYYPRVTAGESLLQPGGTPTFKGVRSGRFVDKLDFISLMLALFCGTASLPHILIRYYTVKDGAAARKSTVVGIASIGFFYVLTLFLGLGAMTSGSLDVTSDTMSAPLLAKSFGELPFAVISAIAFTTVLGTVSGLIMAASGAVAHDLMTNFLKIPMDDHQKVNAGKVVAVVVGALAMVLGVAFKEMNPTFLVGWAFNVAASANLPALVMLLFWKRTTKQGITAAIVVGLASSLLWLLLSAPAYKSVYGLDPARALAPFSQPGIVTIPLGFIVLIVVSLLTRPQQAAPAREFEAVGASR